jgi:hypothetical protein
MRRRVARCARQVEAGGSRIKGLVSSYPNLCLAPQSRQCLNRPRRCSHGSARGSPPSAPLPTARISPRPCPVACTKNRSPVRVTVMTTSG